MNETPEHKAWRRAEFERGDQDGRNGRDYRPTSRPYIEGYENGQLSAERLRNRHFPIQLILLPKR